MKTENVTAVMETGKFIASRLDEVVRMLEEKYGVQVLAMTSDAAANCKLGRKIALKYRKDILSLDCATHLVALIT